MSKRIRILGAGIAGLTAAIKLAHFGYETEIFEKRDNCGARFHGDLQGIENWSRPTDALTDIRRLKIWTTFQYTPFSRVLQANKHRAETVALTQPGFYLIRRGLNPGSLDQTLKEQALQAGVKIHFRETIPRESATIIASGPESTGTPVIAKGITFQTNHEDIAVVYFDDSIAPKGYAYLLVANGQGCLATVAFKGQSKAKDLFQKTHETLQSRFPITIYEAKSFGGYGHYLPRPIFLQGSALCVGEAAGLQDFLWGFGIRTAIESGVLAAHALSTNSDYNHMASCYFMHRQRAGLVNRFLWELLGRENYSMIMKILGRYSTRLLHSMYNENTFQKVTYPVARLWYMKSYQQRDFSRARLHVRSRPHP